jgi:molecular chaperone GrpE
MTRHIDIDDGSEQDVPAPDQEPTQEPAEPELSPEELEAAMAEAVDEAMAEVSEQDAIVEELAAARQEADELRDRFARLQAEWDNFRKRTTAERAEERQRATERLVTNLLPVVDDLGRALEHVAPEPSDDLKAFVEGIAGVQKKLDEVLSRENVTAVGEPGDAFDPMIHQAVGKAEDATVFDETVVQVYQKGFVMAGKVLRPAMVVVSTGGPQRPAEDAEQADEPAEEA